MPSPFCNFVYTQLLNLLSYSVHEQELFGVMSFLSVSQSCCLYLDCNVLELPRVKFSTFLVCTLFCLSLDIFFFMCCDCSTVSLLSLCSICYLSQCNHTVTILVSYYLSENVTNVHLAFGKNYNGHKNYRLISRKNA